MERLPKSIDQRRVFIDTTGFLAITDRRDHYYEEAGGVNDRLLKGSYRLFTTMYVAVETHASLLRAMNPAAARKFLEHGLDDIALLPHTHEDEENAKLIILQQTDKDFSFCDAISFVVMQRFKIQLAFAYDSHFRQYGFSTPIDRTDWP